MSSACRVQRRWVGPAWVEWFVLFVLQGVCGFGHVASRGQPESEHSSGSDEGRSQADYALQVFWVSVLFCVVAAVLIVLRNILELVFFAVQESVDRVASDDTRQTGPSLETLHSVAWVGSLLLQQEGVRGRPPGDQIVLSGVVNV